MCQKRDHSIDVRFCEVQGKSLNFTKKLIWGMLAAHELFLFLTTQQCLPRGLLSLSQPVRFGGLVVWC